MAANREVPGVITEVAIRGSINVIEAHWEEPGTHRGSRFFFDPSTQFQGLVQWVDEFHDGFYLPENEPDEYRVSKMIGLLVTLTLQDEDLSKDSIIGISSDGWREGKLGSSQ